MGQCARTRLHGDRVQRNMQLHKIKISWFACFQKRHTHITCNASSFGSSHLCRPLRIIRRNTIRRSRKAIWFFEFSFVIATSTCSTISLSIPCASVRLCVHWHFIVRQNGCLLCTNVQNWSSFFVIIAICAETTCTHARAHTHTHKQNL